MNQVLEFLKGKKTYIVMAAMLAYAGAEYWSGAMTQDQAAQFAMNAIGLGGLRGGISKIKGPQ